MVSSVSNFRLLKGAFKVAFGDKFHIWVGRTDLMVNYAYFTISSALWAQIEILASLGRHCSSPLATSDWICDSKNRKLATIGR